MAAAFRDARGLFGIEPRDYEGVIALLGNAMLFVVLMHYKSLTYVSLFHASRNSISGTLATLAIPILLVTPALIVSMSAVNAVLV